MKNFISAFTLGCMVSVSTLFAQQTAQQNLDEGKQFYQAKDYAKAEASFQAALQADSQNAAAHQWLGNAYFAEGRKSEAMAEYQLALSIRPNNPALRAFVQSQVPPQSSAAVEGPGLPSQASIQTEVEGPGLPTQPTADVEGPGLPTQATVGIFGSDKAHAIIGLFGGPAFWGGMVNQETQGVTLDFSTGFGIGGYLGCQFDRHFSVALNFYETNIPYLPAYSGFVASGASYELQEFNLTTVCRYAMGDSQVQPYVLLGMGANLSLTSVSGTGSPYNYAATSPLFQFGGGVLVHLGGEWELLGGVEYDLALYVPDNQDDNFSFIPLNFGIQHNLP